MGQDAQKSHELVSAVKELALELGRSPTRAEFKHSGAGREYGLTKSFGSFAALLLAAGLETYDERRKPKPLTNQIFERDLSQTLEEYQPRPAAPADIKTGTLVIPDTHFPFHSQRTLEAIYAWADKHKPAHIVQIGDLYDMYAHSKFPRSQNLYTPQQEEELGRKAAEVMWANLRRVAPTARCVQIKGNHDLRPLKQTLASQPALEHAIAAYLDKLMTFDGVELVSDPRQEHLYEGIQFIHGYLVGLGKHLNSFCNTVHGHTHTGGTVFRPILNPLTGEVRVIWELDAGFAGDRESKVFGYTPQKTSKETNGFGWIDPDGPRFIPA